jgi:hypothetical protein
VDPTVQYVYGRCISSGLYTRFVPKQRCFPDVLLSFFLLRRRIDDEQRTPTAKQ